MKNEYKIYFRGGIASLLRQTMPQDLTRLRLGIRSQKRKGWNKQKILNENDLGFEIFARRYVINDTGLGMNAEWKYNFAIGEEEITSLVTECDPDGRIHIWKYIMHINKAFKLVNKKLEITAGEQWK